MQSDDYVEVRMADMIIRHCCYGDRNSLKTELAKHFTLADLEKMREDFKEVGEA